MPKLSLLKYSESKRSGCVLSIIQPQCLLVWLHVIMMLVWIFSRMLSNKKKSLLFVHRFA